MLAHTPVHMYRCIHTLQVSSQKEKLRSLKKKSNTKQNPFQITDLQARGPGPRDVKDVEEAEGTFHTAKGRGSAGRDLNTRAR